MAYEPLKITPEELGALETKHEDIHVFRGGEKAPWLMVLRRPNRQESLAYKSHAKRDSTTANEQLMRKIVVFPEPGSDALEKQLDRWPFLCDGIADSPDFKEFIGVAVSTDLK